MCHSEAGSASLRFVEVVLGTSGRHGVGTLELIQKIYACCESFQRQTTSASTRRCSEIRVLSLMLAPRVF